MPELKLTCPHCGHDGTPGTGRTPPELSGFNFLEDDVVCRDFEGFDSQGRVILSSEFKAEAAGGGNPRVECRACWQTFPLPEGLERVTALPAKPRESVAAGSPAEEGIQEEVPPEDPEKPLEELRAVTRQAADGLADALVSVVRLARQRVEADVRKLEGSVAAMSSLAERIPALASQLEALRAEVGSLSEERRGDLARQERLENAVAEREQAQRRVEEEQKTAAAAHEAIRRELDGQSTMLAALDKVVRELENSVLGVRNAFEPRIAAASDGLAGLGQRVDDLSRGVQEQAETAAAVGALSQKFEAVQQALSRRMDAQAEALRMIHSAVQVQSGLQEDLRNTLKKLEQIASQAAPRALPEDL